jgi:UDP-glucose 4-epimerase
VESPSIRYFTEILLDVNQLLSNYPWRTCPYTCKTMKILVTGGAGFIGSHLVEQLVESDAGSIVVLDNLHRACLPDQIAEAVRFIKGDVRNRVTVENAMSGCEVVFHLAAQSNVMGAIADAEYCFSSNVTGTFNVLQAALKAGVKRLVFTSSREVYGDPTRLPVRETSPLRPKNAYGTSKVAGEIYCRLAVREGVEVVILRLANVYGPGDRDRVIPLFAKAAASDQPLTVYGKRKVVDFVWIGTVTDALLKSALGPFVRGPANVASGKGVNIVDLAHRVVQLTRSSSPVQIVSERDKEVGCFVADIARGKRLLGIPEVDDPLWALPRCIDN